MVTLLPQVFLGPFIGALVDRWSRKRIMIVADGVGQIVGGIILSAWGGFEKRNLTSMSGAIGMGLGFALVGLTPARTFWLAVGDMFFAGAMNSMTNAPLFSLSQSVVAPAKQGRVFMNVGTLKGSSVRSDGFGRFDLRI